MRHPSQISRQQAAGSTLSAFFEHEGADKSDATQQRYERVHHHLLAYLETARMDGWLDSGELTRLAAARWSGPGGFLRAFGLEEVVCCLPGFVSDEWLLDSRADSRAQVSLMGRLLTRLRITDELDPDLLGCAAYEADDAVRTARGQQSPSDVDRPRPTLRLINGGKADR